MSQNTVTHLQRSCPHSSAVGFNATYRPYLPKSYPGLRYRLSKHSDKNRLKPIWGLKAVCVLQKLYTCVRTHVHIEKQMQAYFCCFRAVQKLLSEAFFPARNKASLAGFRRGPSHWGQQRAPSRRERRTRSLCTPKPACVYKPCPTPVLTPLRWARVPSRPSASEPSARQQNWKRLPT